MSLVTTAKSIARVEAARERFDERGLPGTDRPADPDAHRAHDANSRPSSLRCRKPSISRRGRRRRELVERCAPARSAPSPSRSQRTKLPPGARDRALPERHGACRDRRERRRRGRRVRGDGQTPGHAARAVAERRGEHVLAVAAPARRRQRRTPATRPIETHRVERGERRAREMGLARRISALGCAAASRSSSGSGPRRRAARGRTPRRPSARTLRAGTRAATRRGSPRRARALRRSRLQSERMRERTGRKAGVRELQQRGEVSHGRAARARAGTAAA